VFVTGKLWSNVFEVRLKEAEATVAKLEQARRICWPEHSLPKYGYP